MQEWYEQIRNFERLNLSQAQELYKKALITDNMTIKKEYMDKLVVGTLYVVYDFIKRNNIESFTKYSDDIKDIINAFNEEWIKKIYNGELLKVNSFSDMLNRTYYNKVFDSITGGSFEILAAFEITDDEFVKLFKYYIDYMNEGNMKGFDVYVREKGIEKEFNIPNTERLSKLIPLFEKIYSNTKLGDPFEIIDTNLKKYTRLLANAGLMDRINPRIDSNKDMESDTIKGIDFANLDKYLDLYLEEDIKKNILFDRFGFRDKPMRACDVAKKYGITTEKVNDIVRKVLRDLASQQIMQDYKNYHK